MPALALISDDRALYQELDRALEGSGWTVQWLATEDAEEGPFLEDVVAIGAGLGVRPPVGDQPVLLIVDEVVPLGLAPRFDDLLFRPFVAEELVARLERLVARAPHEIDRRRIEEAVRSMTLGVVVLGPDLALRFANPRAYEIVGHREETITRRGLQRLIAGEDLPRIRESLANGQYPRGTDVHLVRRDGSRILCNCSFAPLAGAEDHTVISFDDVTDVRRAERELLRTMEFLESLIDASIDAIVATDMEQRVVLFNPSAEAISGRHVSDVVGTATLSDLLGPSSAELVMRRLHDSKHGGEGCLEPTMLDLVDVHGERIPVQLSASLVRGDDAPSAVLLVFADLRDRTRAQERVAEAQKKLAFDDKQGVLAELAGTAAHELNQPLTSMMAYAELLQRQSEPGSTAAKAAIVLIREAERMADIVRKIGKITHYETTAYVGHQKIFDLDRAADAPTDPGAEG